MATVSQATAALPGKRQKTEPRDSDSDSDRFEDVVELDASFFSEPPSTAVNKKNDAVTQHKKKRDGFDPRPLRPGAGLLGAIVPQTITDANRPLLVQFCNCALDKYKAENQNAKFEFAELVHFNTALCNGLKYYITFEAKDAADPPYSTTAAYTFQAEVWHKRWNNEEPKVLLCRMKPT